MKKKKKRNSIHISLWRKPFFFIEMEKAISNIPFLVAESPE